MSTRLPESRIAAALLAPRDGQARDIPETMKRTLAVFATQECRGAHDLVSWLLEVPEAMEGWNASVASGKPGSGDVVAWNGAASVLAVLLDVPMASRLDSLAMACDAFNKGAVGSLQELTAVSGNTQEEQAE